MLFLKFEDFASSSLPHKILDASPTPSTSVSISPFYLCHTTEVSIHVYVVHSSPSAATEQSQQLDFVEQPS